MNNIDILLIFCIVTAIIPVVAIIVFALVDKHQRYKRELAKAKEQRAHCKELNELEVERYNALVRTIAPALTQMLVPMLGKLLGNPSSMLDSLLTPCGCKPPPSVILYLRASTSEALAEQRARLMNYARASDDGIVAHVFIDIVGADKPLDERPGLLNALFYAAQHEEVGAVIATGLDRFARDPELLATIRAQFGIETKARLIGLADGPALPSEYVNPFDAPSAERPDCCRA